LYLLFSTARGVNGAQTNKRMSTAVSVQWEFPTFSRGRFHVGYPLATTTDM